MNINIEKLSNDDIDEFEELVYNIFNNFHAYYILKGLSNYSTYVAKFSGKLVGFIQFREIYVGNVKFGHIYYIGVKEEFRRRGIATRLVKFCEDIFVRKKCIFSIATTTFYNTPSINLFKKLGYEVFDFEEASNSSIVLELS